MKVLTPLAKEGKINEDAGIRDKQSIIVNAPIDKVWSILVDINSWPSWNADVKKAKAEDLAEDVSFKYTIGNQTVRSVFQKIDAPYLITWTSKSRLIKAVHVWRLETTGENQTIVSSEESQEGIFTLFYGHQRLHSTLLNWLDRLKQCAEQ